MAARRERGRSSAQLRAWAAAKLTAMPELSPAGQRVAGVLQDLAVAHGSTSVRISNKELQRTLRAGDKTVRAGREDLLACGLIEVVRRSSPGRGDEETEYLLYARIQPGSASSLDSASGPTPRDQNDPAGEGSKQPHPVGSKRPQAGGRNGVPPNNDKDQIDDLDKSDQSARVPVEAWEAAEDAVAKYAEHGVDIDLGEVARLAADLRARGHLAILQPVATRCASRLARDPLNYLKTSVEREIPARSPASQPPRSGGPPAPNDANSQASTVVADDDGAGRAMTAMAAWADETDENKDTGGEDG